MDVSLPVPCPRVTVRTLPGVLGCCTAGGSARPCWSLAPSTGNGPDLSPTSPLPCWTSDSFALGVQTWQSPPGEGDWRGPCTLCDLGCSTATCHQRGETAERAEKSNRVTSVRLGLGKPRPLRLLQLAGGGAAPTYPGTQLRPKGAFQHPTPSTPPKRCRGRETAPRPRPPSRPQSTPGSQTPPGIGCTPRFGRKAQGLAARRREGGERQPSLHAQSIAETDRRTRRRKETPTLLLYLCEG